MMLMIFTFFLISPASYTVERRTWKPASTLLEATSVPLTRRSMRSFSKNEESSINFNHCEIAQDLLMQTVQEEEMDVMIIAESYRHLDQQNWKVATGRIAI